MLWPSFLTYRTALQFKSFPVKSILLRTKFGYLPETQKLYIVFSYTLSCGSINFFGLYVQNVKDLNNMVLKMHYGQEFQQCIMGKHSNTIYSNALWEDIPLQSIGIAYSFNNALWEAMA